MLVYLRIEVIDRCTSYTAYHVIEDSPSYVWRYTSYSEGFNYFRTHIHRGMIQKGVGSLSLILI
jgi:hypothetical protein